MLCPQFLGCICPVLSPHWVVTLLLRCGEGKPKKTLGLRNLDAFSNLLFIVHSDKTICTVKKVVKVITTTFLWLSWYTHLPEPWVAKALLAHAKKTHWQTTDVVLPRQTQRHSQITHLQKNTEFRQQRSKPQQMLKSYYKNAAKYLIPLLSVLFAIILRFLRDCTRKGRFPGGLMCPCTN